MPSGILTAAPLLPSLFDAAASSGWSIGMRRVTQALTADLELPPGPVLEIGCGGGQLLADLQARWPQRTVLGADLHPLALVYARRRAHSAGLTQTALPDLPYAENTFALILALDVFDQEGVELAAALAAGRRALRPGGLLVLRVSAHPRLFGAHDRAFHTGRRYTRRELSHTLAAQGYALRRVTYANFVLGAPVAGLRLLQRRQWVPWRPGLYSSPLANRMVAGALLLEALWLCRANLPVGLSLWVVAEKGNRE